MPRAALEEAIAQGLTNNIALAAKFNVSLQALAYRRQLLGI